MIGRRGAIGGLMASWWAAGNARTPQGPQAREAQRPDRRPLGQTRAGVGPAPQQGTFIGRLVIVSGSGPVASGVFLYNPSPGAANLSASFSESSKDPYGDKLIPGSVAFYNPGISEAIGLQATGLGGFTGSFSAGWTQAAFINFGGNSIELAGSQQAGAFYTLIGPSGDTTGAKDSLVFSTLATGETLLLVPGTYYINAPIVMPSASALVGLAAASGNPVANFGAGSLPLQQVIIKAVAGFTGAGLVTMTSAGSQNGGQYLAGIALDGSAISGANTIDGINITGAVAQVTIRDIVVYGGATAQLGGSGLHLVNNADGNPDALKVFSSQFQKCGTHGVHQQAGVADSYWEAISCTANGSDAWLIINGNSSRFVGCKGETSTGYGFNLTGAAGFTGFLQFTNCSTGGNSTGGFNLSGTGTGTFYLNFCHTTEVTPWTYAGTNNVRSPAAYNVSTAAPTLN